MVTVTGNVAQFCFFRPQARAVHLAGDFNGWQSDELAMIRTTDGYWHAQVELPEGEFKFRYLADGEWFLDYAGFGLEYGLHGPDSIVRIAPSRIETRKIKNAGSLVA